ncbi:MAG: hypothetical protein ACOX8A_12375 [Thermacetogeniaceae bacterium]
MNERDKNNEDLRLIEAGFPCHWDDVGFTLWWKGVISRWLR